LGELETPTTFNVLPRPSSILMILSAVSEKMINVHKAIYLSLARKKFERKMC
jgi:hypothetical protein